MADSFSALGLGPPRDDEGGKARIAASRIASIESRYWAVRECDVSEVHAGIQIGATVAAANIAWALARGVTPEEYQAEVDKRPK